MTPRGRALAALAFAMLIFGRVLALREFVMAGAALALVLGIGLASVMSRRGAVVVDRMIHPHRITAGAEVAVDLKARAEGRLGAGPVLAADRLPRGLSAPVRIALPPGRSERAVSYTLKPAMRGRYRIGPLELTHTDPFGAFERTQSVGGRSVLVVYPHYETVTAMPAGVRRLGVVRRSPLVGQGDEFFALRPYAEGDDLRKVHWPTSAKLNTLVIRQEELTGEPRAMIVLDTNAAKHRGAGAASSLEAAVSACAAVATLAIRHRMRVEILTPEGSLVHGRQPTQEHVLEELATLRASKKDLIDALGQTQRRRTGKAAVAVLITPGLSHEEARLLPAAIAGAPGGAIVNIDANSFVRSQRPVRSLRPNAELARLGFPMLTLRAGDSFRRAWQTAMHDVALAR